MKVLALPLLLGSLVIAAAQTPNATVQKFADALGRRDMKAAVKMVKGGQYNEKLVKLSSDGANWPSFAVSGFGGTLKGNSATVSYRITLKSPGRAQTSNESLSLEKVGVQWFIVPPAKEPEGKEVLPAISFLMAHPEKLPDPTRVRNSIESTQCLSNIKQLALGTIMFQADSDDAFKVNNRNWSTKIMPYLRNKELFHCSLDPKGTTSYSFNDKLSGIKGDKVKDPSMTVLAYEGKNGTLNFRHDGRAAVAFVDGHAKLVNREAAKRLVWKP